MYIPSPFLPCGLAVIDLHLYVSTMFQNGLRRAIDLSHMGPGHPSLRRYIGVNQPFGSVILLMLPLAVVHSSPHQHSHPADAW